MNTFRIISKILKALGNERRLKIICFLKKSREASVSDVAGYLRISLRSTSKHLIVLNNVGIVEKEQRSKMVFYRLSRNHSSYIKEVVRSL